MTRFSKMRFMFATALAVALATPLLAATAFGADSMRCNPAGSQAEMNACAADQLAEADRQLNAAYQALLKKLAKDTAFIQGLRAAQRAWVTFRDAELNATYACAAPNSATCWGSLLSMRYSSYKAKLTDERTKRLRQLLTAGPPADDFAH
jgi:uncharacterized protein YecT (DUF1311 family)